MHDHMPLNSADRYVYVMGGFNSARGFDDPLGEVEVYDLVTNSWGSGGDAVKNLTSPRGDLAAGALKGWVFAVGGGMYYYCI